MRLDDFTVVRRATRLELEAGDELYPPARVYLENLLGQLGRRRTIGTWRGAAALSLFDPPPESAPGKRMLEGRLARVFRRARLPSSVTMALDYACQCDCAHCSAARHWQDSSSLSIEEWKAVIDSAVELGATTIVFTGGEPLLVPHLLELVRHVDKAAATATLFTNGEFLSESTARELASAGLYGVFVSLDSADPQVHDSLRRRPGLWKRAVAGIEHLRAAGILSSLAFCCAHGRLEELDRLMALARDLGVSEVSEFDSVPAGRLLHADPLTTEDHQTIRRKAAEYRRDPAYPPLLAASTAKAPPCLGCFAALIMCYVTAYGDVQPCDFTPVSFGNVRRTSLAEIWKRMSSHPVWRRRAPTCRMESPALRAITAQIPDTAVLPRPVEEFTWES